MKTYKYTALLFAICVSFLVSQCQDADDFGNVIEQETCTDGILNGDETAIDCGGTLCVPCSQGNDFSGTYVQADQMGRPGTSDFFVSSEMKNDFNITVPSEMEAAFQDSFEANLLVLNPDFTTTILGQNATDFTTLVSRDVLWVAQTGVTTYSNGTEILTGRNLSDDAIDFSLLLIYGGPSGTENNNDPTEEPMLISDNVDANDATFSTTFPYLANPFLE